MPPSPPPRSHSALTLLVPYLFEHVGVGLTLSDAHGWHAVHVDRTLIEFEDQYGREADRLLYNERCVKTALRTKRPVVAKMAELGDAFVPVITNGRADRLLVAGPFATRPPSSAAIMHAWRKLTGRHGQLSDPEFARYLSARLATVVFGPVEQRALTTLTSHIAELVATSGDPESLMAGMLREREVLGRATYALRMWEAARQMVNPLTFRGWASLWRATQRAELGLEAVPDRALVALMSSTPDESAAVEDVIRRDGFLRECVKLAGRQRGCICGRIGDQALTLLTSSERSETRTRTRLLDLAEQTTNLARRFGLRLHIGLCSGRQAPELPQNFTGALAAAEEALSRDVRLVERTPTKAALAEAPRELRRSLGNLSTSGALDLVARFDRYLESVAVQAGYRLEPLRHHLDAGFERLAEPYVASGAVDLPSATRLYEALAVAAQSAQTVSALLEAYREAVRSLEGLLSRPRRVHLDQGINHALALMRERLADPLKLSDVARSAGCTAAHFSRLFKTHQGMTFRTFLQKARIERSKQMLNRTTLSIERVGQLCGFPTGPHFHRVFKQVTGRTPASYRQTVRWEKPRQRHRARAAK